MFEQMEQRRLASQKLRQMWQGNLVLMAATMLGLEETAGLLA